MPRPARRSRAGRRARRPTGQSVSSMLDAALRARDARAVANMGRTRTEVARQVAVEHGLSGDYPLHEDCEALWPTGARCWWGDYGRCDTSGTCLGRVPAVLERTKRPS